MFAQCVEHKDWTFWQEYTVASKFRGKYLAVYPIGCCHLVFHRTKSHYTWGKAVTTVHNIIVGRLWIDLVCIHTHYVLILMILGCLLEQCLWSSITNPFGEVYTYVCSLVCKLKQNTLWNVELK